MHKLDGNRTLAHSGGDALDLTVTHVAGYLLAGLAQVIVRTGSLCASLESSNGGILQPELEEEHFCPVSFEFLLMASKNVTMPSTICSPYWWLVGSGVWRIAEDPARGTLAASVPAKFRIFQKFLSVLLFMHLMS